jgi:hypothetical protein
MRKLIFSMTAACVVLAACKSQPKPVAPPDAGEQPSDDAGNPTECAPGDPPDEHGCAPGCFSFCESTGARGACRPPAAACPIAAHAQVSCQTGGKCGRGPCDPDYFDFDPNIFGCETYCKSRQCTLADGGTIALSNDPLHERSMAFHALSSGASFGAATQRSDAGYQNVGTLGESPLGLSADGGYTSVSSSDGGYTNYGGFLRASQLP